MEPKGKVSDLPRVVVPVIKKVDNEAALYTQHFGRVMPLTTVLYSLAAQEGNDGDEGNVMQAAADELKMLYILLKE